MATASRIASQSAVIYSMRLTGAAIAFFVQVAMARMWGAELLGTYIVLMAALNILAMTMPLGFHVIGSYFTATYHAENQAQLLSAFAWRAYLHIAIVFIAVFTAGAIFHDRLTEFLRLPPSVLLPGLVMAAATAIVFVNGALLTGAKIPVAGLLADALLKPLAILLGFVVAATLVEIHQGLVAVMWIAATSYFAIACLHMRFAMTTIAPQQAKIPDLPAESRRWWRFALPWFAISLATDFFFDIDLLLLSRLMSLEELAIFGVCTRIFALISFGVVLVYTVAMPDILEAHRQNQQSQFHRKTSDANLMAAGFAALTGIAAVFSGPLFALFGSEFSVGAIPLAILCAGLTVRAIVGPSALLLSLHDKPYASLPPIALGMIVLVAANHLLVPPFGLTGAASAASLAIAIWSLTQWFVARRYTGSDVSVWPRLRGMIAGLRFGRG